jgi:glycosyltransferase involved in cell wall biosynthesis
MAVTASALARVLLVHNSYRQPGGEDRVFETEAQLLRDRGHKVITYARKTPPDGEASKWRLAGQAFWNAQAHDDLRHLIREHRPDVVHLHNTFPLISPAACYAAQREGVATVQTLHNYRLLCPNGLFFRDGRPCEDCLEKRVPWPAVVHACYRGSRAGSLVAGASLAVHRAAGTWARKVDRFIALTEFARQKFIAGGLAADAITVKPNVVHPDPGPGPGDGGYGLFVGRLSEEKGLHTLLEAWTKLDGGMPLTIVGDGPLAPVVQQAAARNPDVRWLGHRPAEQVRELVGRATCVIVPSIWYETFGLVVIEAFARGTPVIASKLGALTELVKHGRTGLHFTPGDADDLGRQVAWMSAHDDQVGSMRREARGEFDARYAADTNYRMLCRIYHEAIARRRTAAVQAV